MLRLVLCAAIVLGAVAVVLGARGDTVYPVDAASRSSGVSNVFPPRPQMATPLPSPSCAESENLLPNAGFESGADQWFSSGSVTPDSDVVHEGVMSLRLGGSGDEGYLDHRIAPVEPGVTYVFSGWGKLSASGETATLGVQFYDRDGNRLTTDEPAPLTFTSTTFEQQRLTFTIPEQITEIYVYLAKDDGAAQFYADALSLSLCAEQPEPAATPATPVAGTPVVSETEVAAATPTAPAVEATAVAPQATAPIATATVSTPDRSGCDPAYPEARTCIPPGPPFDQGCAITAERNFVVLPPDPQRLDRDRDGIGCEPIRK